MGKEKVTDIIARELAPFLDENGYELHKAEFVKEAKDWFLRVYVDKSAGDDYISIEDCEKVSRYLSERLDKTDPIEQNYYLEVSSPGMDRELLKDSDYMRFSGKLVEVRLYKALNGQKKITGTLEGLIDGNIIVIDEQDKRWELPKDHVAKANLAVVF